MIHKRKNKEASCDVHKAIRRLDVYIGFIVDIYSATELDEDIWLTKTQKQFFIATAINVIRGNLNPVSPESIQIYKKYFKKSTTKGIIRDYINKISKKNWINYDKGRKVIDIPEIFKPINEKEDMIDFNIRLSYEDLDGNIMVKVHEPSYEGE